MLSKQICLFCAALLSLSLVACDEDTSGAGGSDGGGLLPPPCRDGLDNDGDGLIDFPEDPGCGSADGLDEADRSSLLAECSDGVDNDDDGVIDLDDPGCENADDRDESDDSSGPQCRDGVDNDEDGETDFPDDRGCASPQDDDESDDPDLPACSDMVDNDNDGFIDFPADPGCGSEFDTDESEDDGPTRPQCANGLDDDNDGLVDIADPGCSSVADPREQNNADEQPACSNLLDDDLDGVIDFPREPGCSAAGDEDETDPASAPGCGNGFDDDSDGLIDYPDDPGCAGVGDRDEVDPVVLPRCADSVDNDRDGDIDFPEDRGCESAADGSEGGACGRTYEAVETESGQIIRGDSRLGEFASEGSCGGRGSPEVVLVHRVQGLIEALVIRTDLEDNDLETTLYVRRGCLNPQSEVACSREDVDGLAANQIRIEDPPPGEYYIFLDGATGRGGDFAVVVEEVPRAQCLNGLDDDGDGLTDYPTDPGCYRSDDRDETDPPTPPVCSDNEDNDRDGVIDYPLDFGCQSAADNDETDVCGQGVRILTYPVGAPVVRVDTSTANNLHSGTCEASGGPEQILLYDNPHNAALTISVNHPDTIGRTTVYVRSACGGPGNLACDTGDAMNENRGTVSLERVPPGPLFIFVDHPFGLGGPVTVSVESERLPPGCSDDVDNDEDGLLDGDDPGCEDAGDEDERDPPEGEDRPPCFDGIDNDDDGLIDYPFDPGCPYKGGLDEADPAILPECSNGEDDDDDGVLDFPDDVGCSSAGDNREDIGRQRPQCTNRIDDDQDGFTDYPNDPGCAAPGDLSEVDDQVAPPCSDRADNDRDGVADYPFDPGCMSAGDNSEVDPVVAPVCFNQIDDDEDGLTDFPADWGCVSTSDEEEVGPNFPPACSNGRDDDNDGLVDWPNDRGCRFAGDSQENDPPVIPARCSDGVDNDGDALVDLRDFGCENADDDDETDPAEAPLCGNGIDDDEDGLQDWPADPGCQALGDVAEEQACAEGFEALELPRNGLVMGATVEGGADRHRNRCGGLEAPELTYRYVVGDNVRRVTFSADHDETQFPVILSVRRDCEDDRSILACAGDFRTPRPTIVLEEPEAGEYFIIVDGGGPERWVASANPIVLPNDPRGFNARNDINANGWNDGGNDAFDGFGRTTLSHGNGSQQLNVSLGQREFNIGGYGLRLNSELLGNVWRMQFDPVVENDERSVNVSITGNLGSDGSTRGARHVVAHQGRDVPTYYTTDGRNSDPPISYILLPSDPEQFGAVQFAINGDNLTVTANNITLPATFYVALSYADRGAVAQALINNVEIRGSGGNGDEPRFGGFQLTADEE